MTESGIGKSFPNECMNDGGTLNSRGIKTGLGAQSNPDHAETPRSYIIRNTLERELRSLDKSYI